jgi:CBS domain-containing protein
MPSRLKIIPDVVHDQKLCAMQANGRIDEAARRMSFFNVGAIVIVDEQGRLVGIVTERDITRRVVAEGLDPAKTRLGDVMSRNPDTLRPDDTAAYALALMRTRGYRHLPVVDNGRLVGMVSARDLYEITALELEQAINDKSRT